MAMSNAGASIVSADGFIWTRSSRAGETGSEKSVSWSDGWNTDTVYK